MLVVDCWLLSVEFFSLICCGAAGTPLPYPLRALHFPRTLALNAGKYPYHKPGSALGHLSVGVLPVPVFAGALSVLGAGEPGAFAAVSALGAAELADLAAVSALTSEWYPELR